METGGTGNGPLALESPLGSKPSMSAPLPLPAVVRSLLLPEAERLARLDAALPSIESVVAGETDAVAIEATLACLLFEAFGHLNFCGFYRRVGPEALAVGPYQGSLACLRIDFARGVCGACARTGEVQRVPDVRVFPGHIACDAQSRSELVLPVVAAGELRAVLDLDSPHLDAFSAAEAQRIHALLRRVLDRPGILF